MEINRSYYQAPKPSWIMKLLWKAAGADKYLLERSTYSDQIKYMCMGGIIVATGLMAGLAGGYAFYTIFEPREIVIDSLQNNFHHKNDSTDIPTALKASIFGIIWGLIIFNIDRFIVTSTGKGDGTEAITWKELKTAIPRLVMGTIIAFTISKPVEIRMFKSEIDVRLYEEQQEESRKHKEKLNAEFKQERVVVNKRIDDLEGQIQNKEKRYVELENLLADEMSGLRGERGFGTEAEKLEEQMLRLEAEIGILKERNLPLIKENYAELDSIDVRVKRRENEGAAVASGLDGLLERIKLAHEISGVWISLFITLLFLAIELTPIFFKLMLIKGPYDYLEENIKELIKAEQAIEIQYNYYSDKEGVEKHNVINHQVEKVLKENVHLLKKQEEINKKAVDKWGENQNKKVDDNLGDFISEEK